MENSGTLFVVATPIGNLEDLTLRALRILKEVDAIACEDTRVTKKLLARYEIATRVISYHAHSGETKVANLLTLLEDGKSVALVSDAGTPAVSDPGAELVRRAREAGAAVVSVPGPSALTAAYSISGLGGSDFLFLGFLPHKKGRQTLFTEIAESKRPVAFYESPHRLMKTLEALREHTPDHTVYVVREISKIHEECRVGTPATLIQHFDSHPDTLRGEFVLIVSPRAK